ncbi:uncharacterized protein LOC127846440 [Dreissena polymorpha]|uniref:Uncharacterized protein n=1 Tax=Dreissena polymorpha TaxID=45954 RepID=A0A9D4E7Z3_DREPO|nr:uncharacterized protein LOC127846440 [Dreissena polymorpha]KAH3774433.1 hypothetical protein DPMN_175815 [Dreissena polymorpha]
MDGFNFLRICFAVLFLIHRGHSFLEPASIDCSTYKGVALYEHQCRKFLQYHGMTTPWYFGYDDVLTRQELLTAIIGKCRKNIPNYKECMAEIITWCPVQSRLIAAETDAVSSYYCDGTEVANWIVQYIAYREQNGGFSYDWPKCLGRGTEASRQCAREGLTPDPFSLHTPQEGVSLMKEYAVQMFNCMKRKLSSNLFEPSDCPSSPSDQLFVFWIHWFPNSVFGFEVPDENRNLSKKEADMIIPKVTGL